MNHNLVISLIVFLMTVLISTTDSLAAHPPRINVGAFSKGLLDGWEPKIFAGKTDYTIVVDTTLTPQLKVLKASSRRGASGLVYKKRFDLEQTPWLHWSWKTEQMFTKLEQSKRNGDDFVARLYIIIDGGMSFWKTYALNYVWSTSFSTGTSWPNPYTSKTTMFAVESGNNKLGTWQHYSRNVRDDLQKLTGKSVRYIDAIAIMTDSDNAGQQATTFYGDIYFTTNL